MTTALLRIAEQLITQTVPFRTLPRPPPTHHYPKTVTSQGSIFAVHNVCNPNCHFQDTLNIGHANQSSPNIQTLTPQRHQLLSESAAVDILIGPYHDHQSVNSSVCYTNCPFQGTLNSVSTSTYQKHKPCVVSQGDAHNGPSQDNNTSIASCTSPIAPSQDTSNTIQTLTQLPMAEPVMAFDIGHFQQSIAIGPTVCTPNCPF